MLVRLDPLTDRKHLGNGDPQICVPCVPYHGVYILKLRRRRSVDPNTCLDRVFGPCFSAHPNGLSGRGRSGAPNHLLREVARGIEDRVTNGGAVCGCAAGALLEPNGFR